MSWRSAASARTSMTGAVAGWEPGSSPNFWQMLRNPVRKSPQNSQSSVTENNLVILAGLALTPQTVSGKLPLVQFNEVCHENQHHTKYGCGPLSARGIPGFLPVGLDSAGTQSCQPFHFRPSRTQPVLRSLRGRGYFTQGRLNNEDAVQKLWRFNVA